MTMTGLRSILLLIPFVALIACAGTVTPESGSEPAPSDKEEEQDNLPKISYKDFKMPSCQEDDIVRAFPGAEGGGMMTTGGRGGKVYHVTNLSDSGEGSLRAAVKASGPRTVVFDVAGVIELKSKLQINNPDITIAGQTAPGDGVCLKNYSLRINTSNVIIRYIRCRMGDECKTEDDAMTLYTSDDSFHDIIIDHCSISWSTDECGSFYGMTGFTLQWCILSESLRNSVHDKGTHGYGGIWGGANATYHHNLLAHHDSRNPRFDHDYVSSLKGPVDFVNNVVYNWGANSAYGGESSGSAGEYRKYNIVGNYYRPGPATKSSKIRFLDPTTSCSGCSKDGDVVPGHFYMTGNIMHGYDSKSADNWSATTAPESLIATIKSPSPFAHTYGIISLHSAADAFGKVLSYSGASLKADTLDATVLRDTRKGECSHIGSNGSTGGLIDTQADAGGWPEYTATPEELSRARDSDGDGMPDWFEEEAGLDKNSPSDASERTLDQRNRYTNLEMYFQYIVRDITAASVQGGIYTHIQ